MARSLPPSQLGAEQRLQNKPLPKPLYLLPFTGIDNLLKKYAKYKKKINFLFF